MAFASTMRDRADQIAAAIGRAGGMIRPRLAYASRAFAWLYKLFVCITDVAEFITKQMIVPGAVFCFGVALQSADPHGFDRLSLRFSDMFGAGPDVKLFDGALWPLHYLYILATGPAAQRNAILVAGGGGCVLLLAANVLHLNRQTTANVSVKASMVLWWVSLALLAGDVARCLLLPVSWDTTPVLGGYSAGVVLRFAQIVTALYLWSLYLVTARSRFDIERVRGWAWISRDVMGKLRLQAIVLFLLGNLMLSFLDGAQHYLNAGKATWLIYGFRAIVVFLFFSPAFGALTTAASYAIALLSDGRLIIPKAPSPSRPERW